MVQTLAEAVALVKRAHPALGVKKIAPLVREQYPELEASGVEVSTKLVRAALRQLESEPAAQKADDGRTDNSQNSQYSQPVDEEAVDFETPLHSQHSRCPYPELEHGSLREAMVAVMSGKKKLKTMKKVASEMVKRFPKASWVGDVCPDLLSALQYSMEHAQDALDEFAFDPAELLQQALDPPEAGIVGPDLRFLVPALDLEKRSLVLVDDPLSHKPLLEAIQDSPPLRTEDRLGHGGHHDCPGAAPRHPQ